MNEPLNVLLFPVGSAGDVYPYLGLGRALQQRGHQVTLLTSGYFRETAEQAGLAFVDVLPAADFLKLASNPLLWHPIHGTKTILDSLTDAMLRSSYEVTVQRYTSARTVALTSCIGFGPRIAHEKTGLPLITVDLQPMVLWSKYRTPVMPGFARHRWVPHWFKSSQYRIAETFFLDPMICPKLNKFRAELGLRPIRRLTQWWHSPQCILGLFPDWFGPRQPDWPSQVRLSQFPIWTEQADQPLPLEMEEFVQAGQPPIVFTPGSANMFGKSFFQAAAEACESLGRRGMLLSKFDDHVPTRLPETVRHFHYAPFQTLLPRAAAISHHGGIGTTATAMTAGIPQLIMPLSHDQPDNAQRLAELGIGDSLRPKKYRGPAVAQKLKWLLSSAEVTQSCAAVARRFEGVDPFEEACQVIESCLGGSAATTQVGAVRQIAE